MKTNWKTFTFLIIFTACISFFLTLTHLDSYYIPQIKSYILNQVRKEIQKNLPVHLEVQHISPTFFPLGLELHQIHIKPQPHVIKTLPSFFITKITGTIKFPPLLAGQIKLKKINIQDSKINYFYRNSTASSSTSPSSFSSQSFWKYLQKLPFEELSLEEIDISTNTIGKNLAFQINDFSLEAKIDPQIIHLNMSSNQASVENHLSYQRMDFSFRTQLLIDKDNLFISYLNITKQAASLNLSGYLNNSFLKGKFYDYKIELQSNFQGSDFNEIFQKIFPHKTPFLEGQLKAHINISKKRTLPSQLSFQIQGNNILVNNYTLGSFSTAGKINKQDLTLKRFLLFSNAGRVESSAVKIALNENMDFKTKILIQRFNLPLFLQHIKLYKIPVNLHSSGSLDCEGQFKNKFKITCKADLDHKNFKVVRSHKNPSLEIISLKKAMSKGSVIIDHEKVHYQTNLQINNSTQGTSSGTIRYKKGFYITYNGNVNFNEINSIGGLKIEGLAHVQGFTKGNSKKASAYTKLTKGENIWINNYTLGNIDTEIWYKESILSLKNFTGQMTQSFYVGKAFINLKAQTLNLEAQFSRISTKDILTSVSRYTSIPFSTSGLGYAKLKLNGPFQFSKLSYDFDLTLNSGHIGTETFNQFRFHVLSRNGFVEIQDMFLSKPHGRIVFSGQVQPNGEMQIQASGNNFFIEESNYFESKNINLAGLLKFDAQISQSLLKPLINIRGTLTKASAGDVPAQDTQFQILWDKNALSGFCEVFGKNLIAEWNWPFSKKGVLKIKAQSHNLELTQIFKVFKISAESIPYSITLSSQIDLQIPKKKIKQTRGNILIDDLTVKQGSRLMKLQNSASFILRNKKLKIQNFYLSDANSFIEITTPSQPRSNMEAYLKANLDMGLATLFTPFLDNLRGSIEIDMGLKEKNNNLSLDGTAQIKEGFIKIKNLPHSFENLNANLSIADQTVHITSAKGLFARGNFSGNGRVFFKDFKKMILDINGHITKSHLEIPEGFYTITSGKFLLKGSQFPYTLGGNFEALSGHVERNLSATSSLSEGETNTYSNQYLPEVLQPQYLDPIYLDLNVNVSRGLPVKFSMPIFEVNTPITGRVRVQGDPNNPILTGNISTKSGGKIRFQATSFDLVNGRVTFKKSFVENPFLQLEAQARVPSNISTHTTTLDSNSSYNSSEEMVDIRLFIQGPATQPTIIPTSEPALDSRSIISLLTLGFIPSSTQTEDTQTFSDSIYIRDTSLKMTSLFLTNQLNKQLKNPLGVNFNFNIGIDNKSEDIVNTVSIGKQWSPNLKTSISRSFSESTTINYYKTEYQIKKNLFLVGTYEDTQPSSKSSHLRGNEDEEGELGLNLEYKLEFK